MRRLRFGVGQLLVRPSRHLLEPRDVILSLGDLPPGWRALDQRRWRTGISDQPWAQRARQLGSVTAWRSFESPAERQWLWVQASPFANEEDAAAALSAWSQHTLRNLNAQVTVTAAEPGPDIVLPGSRVTTLQQSIQGRGSDGIVRYLLWLRANVFSAMCASGESWTWPALRDLAATQNDRIDAILIR